MNLRRLGRKGGWRGGPAGGFASDLAVSGGETGGTRLNNDWPVVTEDAQGEPRTLRRKRVQSVQRHEKGLAESGVRERRARKGGGATWAW